MNTGFNTLLTYSTSGLLLDSVDVPRTYGDIALTSDGLLYGINYPSGPPTLYTLDPETGAEIASLPLTGAILDPTNINQTSPALNSLSALPNGDLLVAAANNSNIFRIDPATGVTTLFPASFPTGVGAAGDFLSLANGDLLAIGSSGGVSPLFLIHPDMTITEIGTVPTAFGAAQSAGIVYLAGATGDIMRLDTLPTAPSTDPLPFTTVAKTGRNFYGATSIGDAGLCPALEVRKSIDVGSGTTVQPGQTVTYTLTFDNSRGTTSVSTYFTDDLTEVVDDARVTAAPALASGTGLTVGSITNVNDTVTFSVSGVLAAGAVATVTYSATIENPGTGNRVMNNFVIPTGEAPPASCEQGASNCTTNPVATPAPPKVSGAAPKLRLKKTANRNRVKPGQVIRYRLVARNAGKGMATQVMLCDRLPDRLTVVTSRKALARQRAKIRGGNLCWSVGKMKPGQRIVRAFAVRVDRDARAGRIVNRATIDRTNVPGIDARAKQVVRITAVKRRVVDSKVTG